MIQAGCLSSTKPGHVLTLNLLLWFVSGHVKTTTLDHAIASNIAEDYKDATWLNLKPECMVSRFKPPNCAHAILYCYSSVSISGAPDKQKSALSETLLVAPVWSLG